MKEPFVKVYTKEKGMFSFDEENYDWLDLTMIVDKGTLITLTRHRLDGPAIEYANGDEIWYRDGWYHREDGPALIFKKINNPTLLKSTDIRGHWYLNGVEYNKEEYIEIMRRVDSLDPALGLTDPREWVRERFSRKLKEAT